MDRIQLVHNHQRKKLLQITTVLGLAVCLAGCAGKTVEQMPLNCDSSISPYATESSAEKLQVIPEVIGYPADGHGGVYRGIPIQFSLADLERFLKNNNDSVIDHEHIVSEIAWLEVDEGTCASGAKYSVQHAMDSFPSSTLYYDNVEACRYYHSYAVYSGEDYFGKNIYAPGDALFLSRKEFAFATPEEAEQAVREALDTLNLGDLVCNRILYVDHDGLRELGETLSTDEMFAPIKGDTKENNGYLVKEDWSEADDCYMFSFGTSVEGTAMSYFYDDRETYNYMACEIIVIYGAEGILYLRIESPWMVGECLQQPRPIIPPEQIFNQVAALYQNILTYEGVSIEQIRLEYQYRRMSDTYELFPVWRATISRKDPYLNYKIYEYMQFDALTGEEL